MASSLKFTEEQLNYLKVCLIVTDELAGGLREIFKREWDNRYKTTLGEWKDEPKNGMDFWNGESCRNRRRYAGFWKTLKTGKRAEWDCTMLFYAILFSDCIYSLNPVVRSNLDDLRRFRNDQFSHNPRGCFSNVDFQKAILDISTAFHALGLPTLNIREIANKTILLTEESGNIPKETDTLRQQFQEKETKLEEKEEEHLYTEVSPLCIRPPEPTHDVSPRESGVGKITPPQSTQKCQQ